MKRKGFVNGLFFSFNYKEIFLRKPWSLAPSTLRIMLEAVNHSPKTATKCSNQSEDRIGASGAGADVNTILILFFFFAYDYKSRFPIDSSSYRFPKQADEERVFLSNIFAYMLLWQ